MAQALDGQRALVVGGGSGIGFATARLLARDGAFVTIAGRTVEKLESAAERIRSEIDGAGGVGVVGCDVLDAARVRHAVDVAEGGSGLHIAVTVPGGGPYRPLVGYADDEFDAALLANTRPQFLVMKHAGAAMIRAGGGSIVAISSTAAVFPLPFNAAYAAGKAALDHLARNAAEELGRYGVRVNVVRPGLTRTDTTKGLVGNEPILARFLEQQPIARVGEADDIAQAVRYFAGPESSWVTGQCLTVDGGHTLRRFPDLEDMVRSIIGPELADNAAHGIVDPARNSGERPGT
jgi:NAD(P)-dependent dehydrogenase (short-subunit alcohol dehydrogenase family)